MVRAVLKGIGCAQHPLPDLVFYVRTSVNDARDGFERYTRQPSNILNGRHSGSAFSLSELLGYPAFDRLLRPDGSQSPCGQMTDSRRALFDRKNQTQAILPSRIQ